MAACSGEKQMVTVENIYNITGVKHNPVFYSLPRTALSVNVTVVNEICVKGPYADYARKYLGTEDFINENSSKWSIDNIEISSFPVTDSSRTYVVEANFDSPAYAINLTPDGFLESVNKSSNYQAVKTDSNGSEKKINNQTDPLSSFRGLNINRFETVFDTVLHVVNADSIFTAVPTSKKQTVRKTIDEQAQDLANQIYVLRDDRNALLSGSNSNLPSGDALQIMLDKLDKLEESYMSMFSGSTIKQYRTYNFTYVPQNKTRAMDILCKFSAEYGVQSKSSLRGDPVFIEVVSLNDNVAQSQFDDNQEMLRRKYKDKSVDNHGFAYLTPARGQVKIIQNKNVLSDQILNLSQMGSVRYLPAFLLKEKDFKVEFYPQYGTLKSIN